MAADSSILGELPGQRSLAGYSRWGPQESDMTEHLSTAHGYSANCLPSPSVLLQLLLLRHFSRV